MLVLGNRKAHSFLPMGNQPDTLCHDEYKNMDITNFKELYLETMQQVISDNRENNYCFSRWLNVIRLMASSNPIVARAAFLVEKFT